MQTLLPLRRILSFLGALAVAASIANAQAISLSGNVFDGGGGGPLLSGQVYLSASSFSVPVGQTLTVQSGAIVKFGLDAMVTVNGTMNVLGGSPAFFTSDNDDSVGGDTNNNGPSSGSANHWRGIVYGTGASGNLAGALIRFGGRNGFAGVEIAGAAVTMTGCSITNCQAAAVDLNSTAATVSIANCSFLSCNEAVNGVPIASLAGFANNTASGNSGHDSISISVGTLSTPLSLTAANLINGCVILDTNLTVTASGSLALGPGFVMKARLLDLSLIFDGPLTTTGTGGSPVVLTDINDDTAAGDTNENGASGPSPNHWRGLILNPGAGASNLAGLQVRGTGRNGFAGIEIVGAPITMTSCVISNGQAAALDMNNIAAAVSISNCAFNSSNRAVEGIPIASVPGFVNNTATGNSIHNSLSLSSGTVSGAVAITASNMLSNVILSPVNVTVNGGSVLTLGPGVILKWTTLDLEFDVFGSLVTNGTAGSPVVITDINDDQFGGDTNLNGAGIASPNFWRGIVMQAGSGPSTLTSARIRGSGRNGFAAVDVVGGTTTLSGCTIDRGQAAGIDMNSTVSALTVTGCHIETCARAIEAVPINSVPGFTNNTAVSNASNNTLQVTVGTVGGTVSIGASNMLSGTIMTTTGITVPGGATLNLGQGTVIKMQNLDLTFTVTGTLNVAGATGAPVVLTDINDDSAGGDTNLNGPSGAAPNFWRGVVFNPGSAASNCDRLEVRGAGRNGFAAYTVLDAVTIENSKASASFADGFSFGNSTAQPIIRDCDVSGCSGVAYDDATWDSLRNLRFNTAGGNGGNYARVTNSVVGVDSHVFDFSAPNGVVACTTNPNLAAGTSLTLHPGTIVKMQSLDLAFNVFGTFNALGTGYRPVVITTFSDDSAGGDSDLNGPTGPAPNFWRGVAFAATAAPSAVEHLIVRGGGRNGFFGFASASGQLALRDLRVEACFAGGIELSAATGDVAGLVVRSCNNPGLRLGGGAFDVLHATIAGNSGTGIEKPAASTWTGAVRNSISFGNTTANFSANIGASQVFNSDGSAALAGTNGNIFADPLFVDLANGDLTLGPTSPCLGVADVLVSDSVLTDFNEASRRLDHDLSGNANPDMGAFELGVWHLDVVGPPRTGATQSFTLVGNQFGLGLIVADIGGFSQYIDSYGFLTIGIQSTVFPLVAVPTGVTLNAVIPLNPLLEGFNYMVQGVVVLPTNTTLGNFTERYRATLVN